ncbi:MAG: endolytic transglycosylase MltG, partial [Rhodothermales bacterium]|nr:endolytic transglycosylase MltG [Rhodothermales bacterium]
NLEFEAEDFLQALADTELAAELETDTTTLFGFMLPDTYSFYWLTDAETVVRRIKKYFDDFYAKEYVDKPLGLDLSPADVANVAALVEWESNHVAEKPTIAGVYLNRLRDNWRLDADPTVQFALLQTEGKKRRLFFRDYKIQHPYNTYLIRGLPPGPVTNPSPSSIRAALRPESHGYYFFVTNGDGTHAFSRTLREHNAAARRYYALQRARRQSSS